METAARTCPFCSGTGRCAKCEGLGYREGRRKWPRGPDQIECRACDGTGKCGLCHGSGKLDGEPHSPVGAGPERAS